MYHWSHLLLLKPSWRFQKQQKPGRTLTDAVSGTSQERDVGEWVSRVDILWQEPVRVKPFRVREVLRILMEGIYVHRDHSSFGNYFAIWKYDEENKTTNENLRLNIHYVIH